MLDIILLIAVGLLTVFGYLRGFIRELSEIAGVIVGIFLAINFSAQVGGMLFPDSWAPALKSSIAAPLIVILTWVAIVIAVWLMRAILFHGPLKSIDKKLGALFGFLKGVVLVIFALLIIIVSPLRKSLSDIIDTSPVSGRLVKLMEPTVKKYKSKYVKKIASNDEYIQEETILL